jgi:hypothetical protein
MSLFVTPDNQTLLWNTIHKNGTAADFFSRIPHSQKEQWFKNIIQSIYLRVQNKRLTIPDLQTLNKETLKLMLTNIREQLDQYNKPPPNASVIETSSQQKRDTFNEQFSNRQKEYERMFERKAPDEVNFAEKIEDGVISNMDELVKTHLKEREDELRKYAPPPIFPTNTKSSSTNTPVLKIEKNSNISLNVENLETDQKTKKSITWADEEATNMQNEEILSLKSSVYEILRTLETFKHDIADIKQTQLSQGSQRHDTI